ncbi:MAG: NAD-dependent epimerase/dehydratase family protein [Oxalobacteraceae bacterium]|nr:MAG: NAD-dependent epimerase/dehydratase family protein [Oxalobacteraceae bacterium]
MRTLLTGLAGFSGSAIMPDLFNAGHDVVGLVRPRESVQALQSAGARAVLGDLHNLEGPAQEAREG